MAYRILVDGELLWDAVSDTDVVSSASISQAVNAAAYLDMEVSPDAAPRVSEGSSAIEVRWGATTLFHGRATEVSQGTEGTWRVSAVSDVDRLNDVLVRPHSTSGDVGDECPDTPGAYFAWLVARYDERAVGGYRIDVRVNQGDQLADGAISVSDDSWPTVAAAMEDVVLSRGGYLDFTPYAGGGVIDLYADLHDANAQLVDLGENVTDITVTRSTDAQRTALVPYGSDDDGNEWTLSGATEADLQLVRNAGYSVFGDAVYDGSYVAEYGYREERREFPGVTSVAELIREAIPYLRTMVAPTLTVECRAVDMALYREGYEHLRVGQAVRVRSEPHGVDEYLAVQDMALDLLDPSQTAYTLGVSYDTLTGSQSAYLSRLNGEINHALDRVTEAEDSIRHVVNDVDVEYYVSDSPDEPVGGEWGVGTVTAVDNKYVFSHLKKQSADGTVAISDPTLLTTQVRHSLQLHRDLGDEVVWVSYVAANYDVTDEAAGIVRLYGQMGGWEAEEQGAVTVAFGFQDSAYQAAGDGESLAGVGVVTEKSSDIDLGRADIVSYVDNGRVGVYVRLTGKVLVNLYADGEGFSTPFVELTSEPSGTKVFDLADAQTTYESAILQADNAIRAYVAATYATQGQLGEVESAFDIRANQIEASVSEKMDTSVANQTFVNQSTFDQFSDSITTTVEQTQTVAEGAASDAQTAVTKATEVEQTVSGISSTVSEAVETADNAYEKASTLEQTVDGFEARLDGIVGDNILLNTQLFGYSADGTQNGALRSAQGLSSSNNYLDFKARGATGISANVSTGTSICEFLVTDFDLGDEFTFSFYAKGTVNQFVSFFYGASGYVTAAPVASSDGSTGGYGDGRCAFSCTTGWKRHWVTYRLNSSGNTSVPKYVLIRTDPNSVANANLYVCGCKLEKGDVATEWASSSRDAGDAMRVATNYLRFDSSGLCVGNMTGTLGYNALITGSEYQIRHGSTVLSSFGSSVARLGQNSTSAQVQMCGGRATISYGSGTNASGSSRNYFRLIGSSGANVLIGPTTSNDDASGMQTAFVELDGPSQVAQIAGKYGVDIGTSKVNGGSVRVHSYNMQFGNNGTAIRGVYVGTKVVYASNTNTPLLFTASQYLALIGRYWKEGDFVIASNGDWSAFNGQMCGATYYGPNGNVCIRLAANHTGNIRFNYIVVAVA